MDAAIHDPSERHYYLVNRRVPLQIVVQGVGGVVHKIECDVNSFCTGQLLRRTSMTVEPRHSVIYNVFPIDNNAEQWKPLTRSQMP